MKVREHKIFGVYVENLTKHPVDSYEAIDAKCNEGNKNRTVGATLMNASSSRYLIHILELILLLPLISDKRK